MLSRLTCTVFIYLHFTNTTDGARILGVFPMPSYSQHFLASTLLKGLAEAGHDVTMVSPFPTKDLPKNGTWRDIVLEEIMEGFKVLLTVVNDKFGMEAMSALSNLYLVNKVGNIATEQTLSDKKMQNLIKSNEKFDVVIVNQISSDGLKTLANHFNAHLVLLSNSAANTWMNHLVGNPSLPSFHPEMFLGMPKRMDFFQRLSNSLFKFAQVLIFHLSLYPEQNKIIKRYIPNVDIKDALYNVSLVLANSHSSIFDPQPLVPCIIEIGGFHITPPKKLPEDLQKYLDEAEEGVIYFSMGSNLKSSELPWEKRDALIKAFSKRKEKILWKWEEDVLPGQPPNVKLSKWLPQQDILAHPNVKVFMTHGGLLSTTETVYHGVPIVAIPIFGDQKMNAKGAEQGGYGVVLPFTELNEKKLTSVLDEVLNNPKYRENVKERSRIMKDRQVSPLQNAVYWVEYVIRHKGAKHLRVAYLDLSWYQYYLLDVFAFILATVFGVILLVKKTCSYLCKRKVNKNKVKTN